MSILNYLVEDINRRKYTNSEHKKSFKLRDTINKIESDIIIDDKNIDKTLLGDYVKFDDDEINHFKHKCKIPPYYVDNGFAQWNWPDENFEVYVVTIRKRKYDNMFIYEVVQTGDAEITNKHNEYQGADRDVYSIPITGYDFKFMYEFLSDLAIFE